MFACKWDSKSNEIKDSIAEGLIPSLLDSASNRLMKAC